MGHGRVELYTEPPDEGGERATHHHGYFRQRLHRLKERWREAVHTARQGVERGWFARARDWMVCRAAEAIAEQRTLWSLRQVGAAILMYPSDLKETDATAARLGLLTRARRHHAIWLVIDTVLLTASGVFILLPGPNVFAYYFGLRAIAHCLSWRGARQALSRTVWQSRPEPALAELGRLADLPRESRATRVEAIASGLNLPRLAAFFDRTAAPAR